MNITSQKLYAILRKAGFATSKTSTTSVRGWTRSSAGVRVGKDSYHDGALRVEYVFGDYGRGVTDADRVRKLQAIQKVLVDNGIQCYPNTQETALVIGDPDA
jgi:hypothetical protein